VALLAKEERDYATTTTNKKQNLAMSDNVPSESMNTAPARLVGAGLVGFGDSSLTGVGDHPMVRKPGKFKAASSGSRKQEATDLVSSPEHDAISDSLSPSTMPIRPLHSPSLTSSPGGDLASSEVRTNIGYQDTSREAGAVLRKISFDEIPSIAFV
jgi:hypothetical protein